MKLNDLVLGTRLNLEVIDEMGEKIIPSFVSQFEWASDESVAFIAAPIHEGLIFPVRVGALMNVFVISKDGLFAFEAKVIDRNYKENIALLKIQALSEFQKIQRRQFFRFACNVPIKFRVVEYRYNGDDNEKPYKSTITSDLSGGGLGIKLVEKLENKALIECELELDTGKTINFIGQVVKNLFYEDESVYKFGAGVLYKKIENKDREAIISYIFMEQRKLRKKGLI